MDATIRTDTTLPAGYDNQPLLQNRPHQKAPLPFTAVGDAVQEQQAISRERMQQIAEDIQRNLSNLDVGLSFSTYGPNNNEISIILTERATGKVIREIPSKELQVLYTKMQEVVGMIFNNRA